MALHQYAEGDDADRHTRDETCPCNPRRAEGHATVGTGRNTHPYRGVIIRHQLLPAAPELLDRIAVDDDEPESECGHVVVDVDGEQQHHDIPGDDAPHAPTTECGCGPQRETVNGHVVIVHVDQAADELDDDEGV